MRLEGRRQTSNVDDRRGSGVAKGAGLGIGGLLLVAVMTYFTSGGDLGRTVGAVVENVVQNGGIQSSDPNYQPTPEDDSLAVFVKQIMASTEDVWTEEFSKRGLTYQAPKLVLYTGTVQTGCGQGTAQCGPFYCSADQCVYLDLSFLKEIRSQLGAHGGDFANAYVIGHEVGHHVQNLLGYLQSAHKVMAKQTEVEANKTSVRIELQADFLAGVWGNRENARFNSLDPNDLMEAIDLAEKIGDDYLQKKARGSVVPDAFTHGRADQRQRWLKKGFDSGRIEDGDTYSIDYSRL